MGKFTNIENAPLSQIAMTILSPALIFGYLANSELTKNELLTIILAVILFTIVMIILTAAIFIFFKKQESLKPILLATIFPNTGNIGLPIILFAYGEEGLSIAIVIFVINLVLMYTLGVYIASLYQDQGNWKKGFWKIIKLPTTSAAFLGLLFNILNISVPKFLDEAINLVGSAMVPIVLLILGIQLSRTKITGSINTTIINSTIRLIGSPLVMIGIVLLLKIKGEMAEVLVLQNAMPTAVIMSVIAIDYNTKPEIITNTTFFSTIFSFATIAVLLQLLPLIF